MKLDILAIGAHPDDIEVATGGTLLRHIASGKKVGLLDLTKGELSTRGTVPKRTREARKAAQLLGAVVREQLDLPDGYFLPDAINLQKVINKIRKYQPEIILTNAWDDRHPDHQRAADLVTQAVFLANLQKVKTSEDADSQSIWKVKVVFHCIQDRNCKPDLVVDISHYIEQKLEVIRAYQSQFYDPDCNDPETPISCPSFFEALRGRNAMWGRQVGVEYAEAFTVARPIGVNDFFDLF